MSAEPEKQKKQKRNGPASTLPFPPPPPRSSVVGKASETEILKLKNFALRTRLLEIEAASIDREQNELLASIAARTNVPLDKLRVRTDTGDVERLP